MLCENCGQKNATSIFMPPNETKLKYLCGVCYKKLNQDTELDNFAYNMAHNVEIAVTCDCCGLSIEEFNKTKVFGCENCYKYFNNLVVQKFLSNFKEQKYLGRKPNVFYIRQEMKNLEQLIEVCLKNGNYQKATKYGKELEKLKADNYDKLQ